MHFISLTKPDHSFQSLWADNAQQTFPWDRQFSEKERKRVTFAVSGKIVTAVADEERCGSNFSQNFHEICFGINIGHVVAQSGFKFHV